MKDINPAILRLHSIRNQYGDGFIKEKNSLIETTGKQIIKGKASLKMYYETLLFLIAYPDNISIKEKATNNLKAFEAYLHNHQSVAWNLYNSGITGTLICAPFSFEMVKWLKQKHRADISLDSIEADDHTITSVISVILSKVESEILQDANAEWKEWLNTTGNKGEDLLDRILRVFDEADLRPEVRDQLWDSLGINITITFNRHTALPSSLTYPYYHKTLIKYKPNVKTEEKPIKIKLNFEQSEQIIDCARMVLLRHSREIDPMTFTEPLLVNYYKLSRGITVALFGMKPERRQPIDSYMGYMAFKNGLPIAYAGSWILFDSARIGLNVFPAYRGGESRYTFEEVMYLHKQVYKLNRFTVDPYQLGKNNDDGIKSGAFWLYHHIGFRPIKEKQKKIAEEEYSKIQSTPGYRTPFKTLKQLANSRMELVLKPNAVRFDAVDISIAYVNILKKQFNNNRKINEAITFNKLVKYLGIKNCYESKINFVLKNWTIILMSNETELKKDKGLKNTLKKVFLLKAYGAEEDYIAELIRSKALQKDIGKIVAEYNNQKKITG